jgi:alanine racemase
MFTVCACAQILAVAFSEDASKLYAAGIDNNILVSQEASYPEIMSAEVSERDDSS